MNWEAIAALVGIGGIILTLLALLWRGGAWFGSINSDMAALRTDVRRFAARNHNDHQAMLVRQEKHGELLGDHGQRIGRLEGKASRRARAGNGIESG